MATNPEPDPTPAGPAYQGRLLPRPDDEIVDQGAAFDVNTMFSRRRMLGLFGAGVGAAVLAACGDGSSSASSASSTTGTSSGEIPEETNGPYPADGTRDVNVLKDSGIVRGDITSSLDGGTTVEGVPLTLTFNVVDMANGYRAFEGAALYAWQCDAQGRYSMYSSGVEDETFLRGIQVAGADGNLTFGTIVPGCYSGRWPLIHFEVYPDVESATDVGNVIATSQVAIPAGILDAIYATDRYEGSAKNLAGVGSISSDNIFGDGASRQTPTVTGSVKAGYTATLTVNVDTTTSPGQTGGNGGGAGQPGSGGTPPSGGPGGGQ